MPVWRTPHQQVEDADGVKLIMLTQMDNFNGHFAYGLNRVLRKRYNTQSILTDSNNYYKLGDNTYRGYVSDFPQIVGPIVCEPKWDGISFQFSVPEFDQQFH